MIVSKDSLRPDDAAAAGNCNARRFHIRRHVHARRALCAARQGASSVLQQVALRQSAIAAGA
jgi:hypothetical protein